MDIRRVKIEDKMTGDCMIILTDAPADRIQKWIIDYNTEQENGKSTYFDSLHGEHYVKVLHDSGEDPSEAADAVGYDQLYVLHGPQMGDMQKAWPEEPLKKLDERTLLYILDEAVCTKGLKILDGSCNEFIVQNPGSGLDLQVLIKEV